MFGVAEFRNKNESFNHPEIFDPINKQRLERLSKLLIVTAIAHTSAILQGQELKKKGIQKYIVRPESKRTSKRRHSSFYVGQHLHLWVGLHQMYEKIIEQLMQLSRHRLKDCIRGRRARSLALSTF